MLREPKTHCEAVEAVVRLLPTVLSSQRTLLDMVCLAQVMPATKCTAERSFSTLKLMSDLRSTMTSHLNHLMILNYYEYLTNKFTYCK